MTDLTGALIEARIQLRETNEAIEVRDALIAELVEALERIRSYGDDPYGIARKTLAKARETLS